MLGKLFVLFTSVTLLELGLLIVIGRDLGLWWTLVLVFGTGLLGAAMARNQGLSVLRRIQAELDRGRIPAGPALDGLFVLVAGAFLITPGVLTDAVGFTLLIPAARGPVKRWLRRRFRRWIEEGRVHLERGEGFRWKWTSPPGQVIDVTPEGDEDAASGPNGRKPRSE